MKVKTSLTLPAVAKPLPPLFIAERTVHWLGTVNHDSYRETTDEIKRLMALDPLAVITLIVTSPGGPTGVAMSFYDLMSKVYQPALETVGAGDVDSAGVILFLLGRRRLMTVHTTMLLHLAARTFESDRRFSTADLASMLKEDQLKDDQYAAVVAERSGGRLSAPAVLELMARNTVLTAAEAVRLGLAHEILD